ncbi:MAG: hypothetical protein HW407_1054 [Bacteroidetes bacterium]|nr:hypothetical protein [Bacteroidota bacterium]
MKTVCLTLLETPHIEARARKHLEERGISDALYFYGIHAANAGLETIHTYDADHPEEKFNIGPHGVGIWCAFHALWRALLLFPDEHFFVVEHDVVMHDGWRQRMEKAMRDIPKDFDYFFFGSCCAMDKPRTHIAGDVWEVKYPFCNHAYVVARKALLTMIRSCSKCYAPIDLQLAVNAFPKMKVYTLLPRCADQENTVLMS